MRCSIPATRISINSSRLLAVIARNFTRSNRGFVGSSASSSTLWLNRSQDSSRLKNRFSTAFAGLFFAVTPLLALRFFAVLADCFFAVIEGLIDYRMLLRIQQ